MSERKPHLVLVACNNASGEPEMVSIQAEVDELQFDLGHHHDQAIEAVIGQGYEGPFICFDEPSLPQLLVVARTIDTQSQRALALAHHVAGLTKQGELLDENGCRSDQPGFDPSTARPCHPDDGAEDAHSALMRLIDMARNVFHVEELETPA